MHTQATDGRREYQRELKARKAIEKQIIRSLYIEPRDVMELADIERQIEELQARQRAIAENAAARAIRDIHKI